MFTNRCPIMNPCQSPYKYFSPSLSLFAFGIFITILLAIVSSEPALAATYDWTGATSGNLTGTTGNWNPATVPGTNDIARWNSSSYTSAPNATATWNSVGQFLFDSGNTNGVTFGSGNQVITLSANATGSTGIGIQLNNRSGAVNTGGARFTLGGNQSWRNNSANSLTVNGTIALGANTLTFDGNGATTQSGIISGTGGLVISNGIVNLNGANTFTTGGVSLSGGTLVVGNAKALGGGTFTITGGTLDAISGNTTISNFGSQNWNSDFTFAGTGALNLSTAGVTLGGNRTVTVSASTLTVGGVINDGGNARSLTKAGAGTMVLSGANTYTGATNINNGTLSIGNATTFTNTSAINLASGSRLEVTAASANLTRLSAAGGGSGVVAGSFLRYSTANQNSAGAANGPGTIFGTVELNLTNINPNYTLDFGNGAKLTPLVTAVYTSGITLSGNASIDSTAAALTGTGMSVSASSAGAKTLTLNGSTASSITGNITDGSGSVGIIKTGSGTWTLGGTGNTFSGGTKILNGILSNNVANVTDAFGTGPITLGDTSGSNNATLYSSVISNFNSALIVEEGSFGNTLAIVGNNADITLNGTVALNNNLTFANALIGKRITFNGKITQISNGTGHTITIGATIAGTTATAAATGLAVFSGGVEIGTGGLTFANNATQTVTVGSGNITSTTTGNLTFNANSTGAFTISATSLNHSGSITNSGSSSGATTISGAIGANVTGLNQNSSTSNLIISAANAAFIGDTTLTSGVLNLRNQNSLQNSVVNMNGGTITFGSAGALANVSLGGLAGSGNLNLNDTAGTPAAVNLTIGNSNTSYGGNTLNPTYSGALSNTNGNASLTKTGSNTQTLAGTNTYTGNTTINAGTLQFGKVASLYNGTEASWTAAKVIVNSGGTLALNVGGVGEFSTANVSTILTNIGGSVNNNGLRSGSAIGFDTSNAGGSFTITNNIANSSGTGGGAIALAKLGTGTLVLSGSNSYSGGTTISAGTLQIGNGSTAGSVSGNILNNSALVFNRSDNTTYSGIISGTGSVTQSGVNTLTLNGTNTYSGGTTISTGTLALGGGSGTVGNGSVSISNGAALQLNNSADTTLANAISGAGNIVHTSASVTTLSGSNTNTGAVQSTAGGTLLFSGANALSTGITSLDATSNSTLSFVDGTTRTISLGSSGISLNSAALSLDVDLSGSASDRLDFGGSASLTGNNIVNLSFLNNLSGAQTWTLLTANDGLNGTWNLGTYAPKAGFTFTLSSNATSLWLSAAVNSNSAYWTGSGGTSWSATNFSSTDGDSASIAGGALTSTSDVILAATGAGNLTTTLDGDYTIGTLLVSTPEVTIYGSNTLNVTSSDALGINISAAGNTTIGANLAGNAGLTKSGAGTLHLNGTNSYSGGTTITGGTVVIGADSSFGNSTGIINVNPAGAGTATIRSGANGLEIANDITLSSGTAAFDTNSNSISLSGTISGAGALAKNGLGNLTLNGQNTYTGTTTISAGTLTLSGGLNNSSISVNGGEINQTSTGTIAGTGTTFTLTSGNATLAGTNTYTGATTINGGILSIASITNGSVAGALGNSTNAAANLVLGGGTLAYTGSANGTTDRNFTLTAGSTGTISVINAAASLTISGTAAGTNGALTKAGLGTLTLSGNNAYTGATTISAGTLQISPTGLLGGGNYSGNISNSGAFLFGSNSTQALSGIISGSGSLTKNGSNTLTLSNTANSYTGDTIINSGILSISSIGNVGQNSAVGAGSLIKMGSGATQGALTYTGVAATTNKTIDLSGTTGNALINASGSGLLTFANNFTASVSGAKSLLLRGTGQGEIAGSIVDSSSGATSVQIQTATWTLSGNNSFTGALSAQTGTTIISSIANVGQNSAAGAGSSIKIGNSNGQGTLIYTGVAATTNKTIDLAGTTGNATITQNGTGLLKFTSDVTATGAGSKTLFLQGSTSGIGEIAGAVLNNNSTNTTSLTKNGTGTWILSGNNTYTGATTINAGTLQIGNGGTTGSLSISSAITNNGTLAFNRSDTLTQGTNFNSVIGGTGNLTQAGSGTLFLAGTNTYSGLTTIGAGNISINSTTALASTSGINLANSTALIYTGSAATLNPAISVSSGTGTIRNDGIGLLTLSGGLSKNGSTLTLQGGSNGISVSNAITGSAANSDLIIDGGSVTLASANAYNGPTFIINGATLTASATNALPTANGRTAISLDATGSGSSTLALGASQSIASLDGNNTSTVTLGSNSLTIGTTSGNTTYAGRITGSSGSALVKDGSSTQVLSGNNSAFTGSTTIHSGTLQAASVNALGGCTVIDINSGSFLVTAANAVNDTAAMNLRGGALAVSGTFDETFGALTLSANSTIDLAGFTGTLRFGGVGSWAAGTNLAIWNWNGINQYGTPVGDGANNRHVVFTNSSGLGSYLDRISFYSDSGSSFVGNAFEVGFAGPVGSTEIIAVPEPETYFTFILLLMSLGFYQLPITRKVWDIICLTFVFQRINSNTFKK